jgi:hypothetical protein
MDRQGKVSVIKFQEFYWVTCFKIPALLGIDDPCHREFSVEKKKKVSF